MTTFVIINVGVPGVQWFVLSSSGEVPVLAFKEAL
jgi:hypothetical protein